MRGDVPTPADPGVGPTSPYGQQGIRSYARAALDRLRNLMPGAQQRAALAAAAAHQAYVQNIADRRAQIDEYLTGPARHAFAQAQQLAAQSQSQHAYAQRALANATLATTEAQQYTAQLDQLNQQILQADTESRQAATWATQAQTQANQLAQAGRTSQANELWTQAQQASARADQLNTWLAQARPHAQSLQTTVAQLQARHQQLTDAANRATAEAHRLATQSQSAQAHGQNLWNQAQRAQRDLSTSRPDLWRFANQDTGRPMQDGDPASDTSRRTGDGNPPPSDRTRRYDQPGGYRRPRLAEQRALEGELPRNPDGSFQLAPDPRGRWLRFMNGIGRALDPTRNVNCNDATLSLFETFFHGRPRVAAPRTFDGYGNGQLSQALNGETGGPGRVEDVTGGRYQTLTGNATNLPQAQRQQAVQNAFNSVQNQLLQAGHGSFAFLITAWSTGGSHAWAAVNYQGTIIYVDAQSGVASDTGPMYSPDTITMMDALVVGANGVPVPFHGAPQGTWNARPPTPLYLTPPAPVNRSGPHRQPAGAGGDAASSPAWIRCHDRTVSPRHWLSATTPSPTRARSSSSTRCTARPAVIRPSWSVRSTARSRAPHGAGRRWSRPSPTAGRRRSTAPPPSSRPAPIWSRPSTGRSPPSTPRWPAPTPSRRRTPRSEA